jgi:ATP-binding cassette, subfamily B, bacterial MsbA
VVITVSLFLLKNIFDYIQRFLSRSLEQLVVRDLRNDLFNHLQDLSLGFFHRNKTGQLISCMSNDVGMVRSMLTDSFSKVLMAAGQLVVFVSMLMVTSWKLTLMAFLLIPPMAVLVTWVAKKLRRKNLWLQNAMGEITAIFQEAVSGIRVVKAFGMENFERRKFAEQTRRFYREFQRTNKYGSLSSPLTETLMAAAGGVFLLYGGRQVLAGQMPAQDFLFFLMVSMMLMSPIKVFGNFNDVLQQGLAACDRIFAILDTAPQIIDAPDAVRLEVFSDRISYENVSFSYDGVTEVLSGINLDIRRGEAVAIVGPSGAGKSTLMDLIPRFHDVSAGRITIDGTDVRGIRVANLRGLIGIVTQETILFNDTVRNNIAYGLSGTPIEAVEAAAKAANAHEFICQMEDGYDTVIGERGTRLSGGQRQRIAIARAILKNPQILIFDEATSSLDTENELLVQQAIERLMKGRTSLVIAHRLSTIQYCDRIIVLNEGSIVESGSHGNLMAQGGLYRRLHELQFQTTNA